LTVGCGVMASTRHGEGSEVCPYKRGLRIGRVVVVLVWW
jgi:hypothetical protein